MEAFITQLHNNDIERNKIVQFLFERDLSFNIPLSKRTDIPTLVDKLLTFGKILGIVDNGELLGIIGYYCNDIITHKAYCSIYCTTEEAQHRKWSLSLMIAMMADCRNAGMDEIYAETTDTRALALYKRLGWEELPKTKTKNFTILNIKADTAIFLEKFGTRRLLEYKSL